MRLIFALVVLLAALPAPASSVITCLDTVSVIGKSAEPWPNCKSLTKTTATAAKAVIVSTTNTGKTPQWVTPASAQLNPTWYVFTGVVQANGLDWAPVCQVFNCITVPPPVTPPPASTIGQASLTWSPSATAGVSYNVYRGASATSYAPLAQGVSSPYVDKSPLIGATYTYLVTASNANGESAALASPAVTIKATTAAPAAAAAVKATSP